MSRKSFDPLARFGVAARGIMVTLVGGFGFAYATRRAAMWAFSATSDQANGFSIFIGICTAIALAVTYAWAHDPS